MTKKVCILFGAGAELEGYGMPSGNVFMDSTLLLNKKPSYLDDLCKHFSGSDLKVSRTLLRTMNRGLSEEKLHERLDSYFNSIVDPSLHKQWFSVVFNYYWSCYFAIVNPIMNLSDALKKQYCDSCGVIEHKILLDNIVAATNDMYSESFKIGSTYYSYLYEYFENNKSSVELNGVITTNYFKFAEEALNLKADKISYINGKLSWFEFPTLLEIHDFEIEDDIPKDKSFFPFIFGQSYTKPIVDEKQIIEFSKASQILKNSDVLVIIGYSISPDDNHLNSYLHNYAKHKRVIYVNNSDNHDEICKCLKLDTVENLKLCVVDYSKDSLEERVRKICSCIEE